MLCVMPIYYRHISVSNETWCWLPELPNTTRWSSVSDVFIRSSHPCIIASRAEWTMMQMARVTMRETGWTTRSMGMGSAVTQRGTSTRGFGSMMSVMGRELCAGWTGIRFTQGNGNMEYRYISWILSWFSDLFLSVYLCVDCMAERLRRWTRDPRVWGLIPTGVMCAKPWASFESTVPLSTQQWLVTGAWFKVGSTVLAAPMWLRRARGGKESAECACMDIRL